MSMHLYYFLNPSSKELPQFQVCQEVLSPIRDNITGLYHLWILFMGLSSQAFREVTLGIIRIVACNIFILELSRFS